MALRCASSLIGLGGICRSWLILFFCSFEGLGLLLDVHSRIDGQRELSGICHLVEQQQVPHYLIVTSS